MAGISIGEIAGRVGIEPSTIRYYESIGLMPPPPRVNGRRSYPDDTLKRLALIRAAKAVGFTIAEIQTLMSAWESQGRSPREWPRFVTAKIAEMDATIARARKMRKALASVLECRCWDDFAMPLDTFIASLAVTDSEPREGAASIAITHHRLRRRRARGA
jgi:MerR family transcriptional regulator, redox-sensitive transcriptional activator SoxR